jgi:prevent-host-death family protein
MTVDPSEHVLGVAETKSRFSELIERVRHGERFVVARRGKPVLALVPPDPSVLSSSRRPTGLAAIAGALEEWAELPEVVEESYASRRRARDRTAPDLD